MGIPGLFRTITKKYPHVYSPYSADKRPSTLFVDFNGIIYNAVELVRTHTDSPSNAHIIDTTLNLLGAIADALNPTLVYLAVDGPAPCAKVLQQRNRRFKKLIEKQTQALLKKKSTFNWSTNHITPGTEFMEALSKAARRWADKRNCKVIVSSYHVAGEGEHKIMDWMRANDAELGDNIYVYSNDGDFLVLLSQFFSEKRQMRLIADVAKSSNPTISQFEGHYYVIDVEKYYAALIEEIKSHCGVMRVEVSPLSLLHDFMFFMSFCGNDFVKAFPYLKCRDRGVMEFMIRTYARLLSKHNGNLVAVLGKRFIVHEGFFRDFIRAIAGQETKKIREMSSRISREGRRGRRRESEEDAMYHLEFYNAAHPLHEAYRGAYRHVWGENVGHKERKRRYYGVFTNRSQSVERVVERWLESVMWTFQYYMVGASSWEWMYPYAMAPMPSDVLRVLEGGQYRGSMRAYLPVDNSKPMKPFLQLALVLPKSWHHAIDAGVRARIDKARQWRWFYPDGRDLWLYGLDEHKYIYSEPRLPHWTPRVYAGLKKICDAAKNRRNVLHRRDYNGRDNTDHNKGAD